MVGFVVYGSSLYMGYAMATLILEFSGPRLGSSSFRKKMRAFSRVEALGEFFRPQAGPAGRGFPEHLLEPFAEVAAGRQIRLRPTYDDIDRFIAANPVDAIDIALTASAKLGRDICVLKLGLNHVSIGTTAEIVRRFRPVGIILLRAPIDQFISREKAFRVEAWSAVDTTEVKPTIAAEPFLAWRWRQQHHLQMGRYILEREGCRYISLAYEDVFREASDPMALLADRFGSLGLDLGEVDPTAGDLRKQDRASSRADKVANWDEFVETLRARGQEASLENLDLKGNPLLLRVQLLAETMLPREMLRRVAAMLGISGMPQRAGKRG